MKEAGYDGKPIVVLDPTNIAMLHAVSLVTGELLQKIGCEIFIENGRFHGKADCRCVDRRPGSPARVVTVRSAVWDIHQVAPIAGHRVFG